LVVPHRGFLTWKARMSKQKVTEEELAAEFTSDWLFLAEIKKKIWNELKETLKTIEKVPWAQKLAEFLTGDTYFAKFKFHKEILENIKVMQDLENKSVRLEKWKARDMRKIASEKLTEKFIDANINKISDVPESLTLTWAEIDGNLYKNRNSVWKTEVPWLWFKDVIRINVDYYDYVPTIEITLEELKKVKKRPYTNLWIKLKEIRHSQRYNDFIVWGLKILLFDTPVDESDRRLKIKQYFANEWKDKLISRNQPQSQKITMKDLRNWFKIPEPQLIWEDIMTWDKIYLYPLIKNRTKEGWSLIRTIDKLEVAEANKNNWFNQALSNIQFENEYFKWMKETLLPHIDVNFNYKYSLDQILDFLDVKEDQREYSDHDGSWKITTTSWTWHYWKLTWRRYHSYQKAKTVRSLKEWNKVKISKSIPLYKDTDTIELNEKIIHQLWDDFDLWQSETNDIIMIRIKKDYENRKKEFFKKNLEKPIEEIKNSEVWKYFSDDLKTSLDDISPYTYKDLEYKLKEERNRIHFSLPKIKSKEILINWWWKYNTTWSNQGDIWVITPEWEIREADIYQYHKGRYTSKWVKYWDYVRPNEIALRREEGYKGPDKFEIKKNSVNELTEEQIETIAKIEEELDKKWQKAISYWADIAPIGKARGLTWNFFGNKNNTPVLRQMKNEEEWLDESKENYQEWENLSTQKLDLSVLKKQPTKKVATITQNNTQEENSKKTEYKNLLTNFHEFHKSEKFKEIKHLLSDEEHKVIINLQKYYKRKWKFNWTNYKYTKDLSRTFNIIKGKYTNILEEFKSFKSNLENKHAHLYNAPILSLTHDGLNILAWAKQWLDDSKYDELNKNLAEIQEYLSLYDLSDQSTLNDIEAESEKLEIAKLLTDLLKEMSSNIKLS